MSEIKCTAFVMAHNGQRLGWKIVRDDVSDCFPSSRYFGVGPLRPPRAECVVERQTFADWIEAEKWCASFPAHSSEGGAEPRTNPTPLEGMTIPLSTLVVSAF